MPPAPNPAGAVAYGVELLGEELAPWKVPGLELAVVAGGEARFCGGLGVRGVEDPTPVGPRTRFHHGSCGKAFTGLLAAVLAEEGLVDLDAPARRYLPELSLPDPVIAERVTTRDLLSHRSGLARHDLAWIFNPSWTRREMVGRLAHLPLAGDLRNQWIYSNFGFTAAALVMERATGSSWEEQVRARVLEPLGMDRTIGESQPVLADEDHARPQLLVDGKALPTAFRWLDGPAPAGGLLGCAEDSVRWLLLQTGGKDLGVSPAAVSLTHEMQVPVPSGAISLPGVRMYGYGMGWVIGSFRGRPLVWHNGGIDGFRTDTLLLPEQGIGILASANLHATSLTLAAVFDLAERLLGEAGEQSWYDLLRPKTGDGGDGAQAAPDTRPGAPPARPRPPTHDLADYAGRYVDPGYGEVVVSVAEGALALRVGEFDVEARHRHYDTWDLHYGPLEVDLTATFVTDPEGRIAEAVLPLDPACPPTRFRRQEAASDPAGTVGP
ncbi:MAG TPA: serine hydrolase [Acidimicrobiales bacterium]|nr:serine hydrolase [Acidimicrobiales bacterium]